MEDRVREQFREAARVLDSFGSRVSRELVAVARRVAERLGAGGKVVAFGNGGSAADAQHLAAELVNRFCKDRAPLAGLALTTDTSALTAIGNDLGFEQVFARQVLALARPGDVAVGITTSGASDNVLRGLAAARRVGCLCIALTGEAGLADTAVCDHVFCVPSRETPRVQEGHTAWIHAFCGVLEEIAVAPVVT